jgi:hypothetical protein
MTGYAGGLWRKEALLGMELKASVPQTRNAALTA